MNSKIFSLVQENLSRLFDQSVAADTDLDSLSWTVNKRLLFENLVGSALELPVHSRGTVEQLVDSLGQQYLARFFGQHWGHAMDQYRQTGWALVDRVNALNPGRVLDVGCGFNLFRGRIQNVIGLDPYNDEADVKLDIIDYAAEPQSFDVILALGSLCYNSELEVEQRFAHCVRLLKSGGPFILRVNPDAFFQKYPYIDFFAWTLEVAKLWAQRYNLCLDAWEPDALGRYYVAYTRL